LGLDRRLVVFLFVLNENLRHILPEFIPAQKVIKLNWDKQVDQLIQQGIDDEVFSGATVLISNEGKIAYEQSFGYAVQYANAGKKRFQKPLKTRNDTVYDIASLTKIFTAMAVMQLYEQGKIGLDQPVARYLPAFAANGKENVTVRQLLTHTSGLPSSLPLYWIKGARAERVKSALEAKLVNRSGTKVVYSDLGFIVLGELVAQVSGMSLDQYVQKRIAQPLVLTMTRYRPPANIKQRIAATEWEENPPRGLVWGEVHDENAWALHGVAGHAGLFSTAEDLHKVALLFLKRGKSNGHEFFQPKTIEEMTSNQTKQIRGAQRGLGFELNQEWYMGPFAKQGAFGHTGFTGTSIFISPQKQLIVILLTNRVHPVRTGPNINPIRKKLAQIAAGYVK
jgi:CubicO group peptidase (beta-lactamase class C family)